MDNKSSTTISDLTTRTEYQRMLEESSRLPVFLLKHSTRCPYSTVAWKHFQQFAAENDGIECHRVLVIENRDLSQYIAQESGVPHQSPQVLLFRNGKVVWQAYRSKINRRNLEEALRQWHPDGTLRQADQDHF